MQEFSERALEVCIKENASYADIRVVTIFDENITIKNGNIQTMDYLQVKGFGIRVIADGGLGFAGSYKLNQPELEKIAKLAAKIAKASGSTRKDPIVFVDEASVDDSYSTPIKKDPFAILSEALAKINVIGRYQELQDGYNWIFQGFFPPIKLPSFRFTGSSAK